jgi:ABC-type transport system involved in multi-copper enzyme maturation permease subunit
MALRLPRSLRDALVVAGFELRDALRSRKVVVLLVLYLAGAVAACGIFLRILHEIEKTLASELAVAAASRPGAATHALFATAQFRSIVGGLVGDRALAGELLDIPPMALFYGWLALTFGPLLAVIASCDAIAGEIGQGSARFALVRADRASWAVGKLLGQAGLVAVGIFAGALAAWVMGLLFLQGFAPADSAFWLARLGTRAWIYSLPFLGLSLGLSQVVRSANAARGAALVGLVAIGLLGEGIEELEEVAPALGGTLMQILPRAHSLDLWRPDFLDRLPAMVMLLAIGTLWFAAGHAIFRRRDA